MFEIRNFDGSIFLRLRGLCIKTKQTKKQRSFAIKHTYILSKVPLSFLSNIIAFSNERNGFKIHIRDNTTAEPL